MAPRPPLSNASAARARTQAQERNNNNDDGGGGGADNNGLDDLDDLYDYNVDLADAFREVDTSLPAVRAPAAADGAASRATAAAAASAAAATGSKRKRAFNDNNDDDGLGLGLGLGIDEQVTVKARRVTVKLDEAR